MSLLLNDKLSLFQPTLRFGKDSLIIAQNKVITAKAYGMVGPIESTNYRIFKTRDKVTTVESVSGLDLYLTNSFEVYDELGDIFDWKITGDTMSLHGFVCQQALLEWGGRNWEAWFAPDIPIFDGPYKFQGLPGLIVRMKDHQGYFVFELLELSKVNKFYRALLRKDLIFNPTTKEGFFRHRKQFRENMYEHAVSQGVPPDEGMKKNVKEFVRKDNNYIER